MSARYPARYGECACCGQDGTLTGRGLRRSCERRIRAAGELAEWPTGRSLMEADVRMVLATGAPYRVVAARCGVTEQTVVRIVARQRLTSVPGTGVVLGPVRAVPEEAAA